MLKNTKDVHTAFTSFEAAHLMPTSHWGWFNIGSTQNCQGYWCRTADVTFARWIGDNADEPVTKWNHTKPYRNNTVQAPHRNHMKSYRNDIKLHRNLMKPHRNDIEQHRNLMKPHRSHTKPHKTTWNHKKPYRNHTTSHGNHIEAIWKHLNSNRNDIKPDYRNNMKTYETT